MKQYRAALTVVLCGVAAAAIVRGAAEQTYTIDASRSRATIEVGKSGALSFAAGHTHEVVASGIAGAITVDTADPARSTGRVTIEASALKVNGQGEPPDDVPKVQATMVGPRVLDVEHYPTITFVITSIAIKTNKGTSVDDVVAGRLTLRDVTRSITVPVAVRLEGHTLSATGRVEPQPTEYRLCLLVTS